MARFRRSLSAAKNFLSIPNDPFQPLTRFDLIRLKNWMLLGIFLANGVAYILMDNFLFRGGPLPSAESLQWVSPFGDAFRGIFFLLGIILFVFIYELPIRRTLNDIYHNRTTPPETIEAARRRLLNEPFYMMALNLCIWILAAFFFAYLFKIFGEPRPVVFRIFLISLNTGLVTAVMCFFLLEHVSQKHISRFFFPEGGLYNTSKTIRIRIFIRFIALLFACNIIPLLSFMQLSYLSEPGSQDTGVVLREMRTAILTNSIFFIVVGLSVTQFVIANFAVPLREIIQVLKEVRSGNFDRKVIVRSNDEIGYTGDVVNEMATGLKERDHMRQSLFLAREVQQNLLPAANPKIEGLDIAGSSIYCDETGGDYYDFIIRDGDHDAQISIAIGDVSGHGISSALLMAAVRSSLRQRSSLPGSAAEIISDVNRQLVGDVEDSGQFVTMFYMMLDPIKKHLQYVRAGHDPAILYDPDTGTFKELGGTGMALGVDKSWNVRAHTIPALQNGHIIFLSTDGIWEARNPHGEMFGKEPIYDLIRNNSSLSANQILNAMIESLKSFQQGAKIEDDITLVIIKICE
jgi:sigma-B regulation protein RsbU (phosphoserine phosphatase)